EIGSAAMVNIVGAKDSAREFLQQVIFFVGGAVGADDADGPATLAVTNLLEPVARMFQGLFPGCRNKFSIFADQGLAEPCGMIKKVESVTALDTEKVAIDSAFVAIIAADDVHSGIGAANAQGGFAAVAAVRADGAHVLHLPRARLVTVGAGGEGAHRADVNAH